MSELEQKLPMGLFTTLEPSLEVETFLVEMPVSVIEIGKQSSGRRSVGGHYSKSSRAEYSHFPAELLNLCFSFYLRESDTVFDPFAGWGERHQSARDYRKSYTGFDVNPAAIAAARLLGVENTLNDSLVADIPYHDGLITCPPYWNLERYSQAGIETAKTWEGFLDRYRIVLDRCYDAARMGAFYCVLVGDWRRDGRYYDFTHQTRLIFDELGATIWDEVIVSRRSVSKLKVMLPQAKRLGYSVKVHETLLIFQKR